ncbi:MAG: hypothetical protein HFP77_08085 [Methylococcales symbiont of Iophon sp. n. MRB-2018]|nr:MAG: hypothetical protein HFP77_08085 [Methylococcales symbiont of Iophon sp. n. MRB-2018]KAF3979170.1 MAG: hypothetical protein HFP76_08735 [Methylococcales symbiont of Iophon sp. n. MRB-2018]
MSILDTIKALFCSSSKPANKTNANVADPKPAGVEETAAITATVATTTPLQIPEDSTLKRHFLSALKVEVEASMPPRPTELALMRHYDSTVKAKMDDLLA